MNCVAIPHTEEKRSIVATQLPPPSPSSLRIIQNEFTLPTPIIIDHNSKGGGGGDCGIGSGSGSGDGKYNTTFSTTTIGANKTQSLQWPATATTHLYCRSLDKDATAMATPHRRPPPTTPAPTTSRSFASCLRGERDDPYIDYQKRALQYDTPRQQQQQQQQQQLQKIQPQKQHPHQPQHQYHQHQFYDENHPIQVLQTSLISMSSCVGSNTTADDTISLSRNNEKHES